MKNFIIALSLMLFTSVAFAETEVDNDFVEVGVDVMSYANFDDDAKLNESAAFNVRWGTFRNTGLYAWGSYEKPKLEVFETDVANVEMFGLGLGWRMPFMDRFYGFAEAGAYFPNSTDEKLVPAGLDYDTSYGGSLGVGFDLTDNFTLNAKYRYLESKRNTFGDDKTTVDLSAVSVGLSYRF